LNEGCEASKEAEKGKTSSLFSSRPKARDARHSLNPFICAAFAPASRHPDPAAEISVSPLVYRRVRLTAASEDIIIICIQIVSVCMRALFHQAGLVSVLNVMKRASHKGQRPVYTYTACVHLMLELCLSQLSYCTRRID
jgi:hypothetical protein